MICFAHRGASALAPANSKEAFSLARQKGASSYELDVHLTQDGQLLVHHDYSLAAPSGQQILIKNLTADQAQQIALPVKEPGQEPVYAPLLQEVIAVVKDGLDLLNIELKNDENIYPGIEEVLWQCLQRQGADLLPHILCSSFDYPTLQRLHALAAQLKIGLLTRSFDPALLDPINACSVHINQTRITPQIIQTCHERKRHVFVYTVNDPADKERLIQMGVDGIFTDDPALF